MNILVCIKLIQNPELAPELFRVDEQKKEVIPAGLSFIISPFDEQAIEAALRIRDKNSDARITVVTFGPKTFAPGIKAALSMGADEGIYVSNEGLEQADSFNTASVLCGVLKKLGNIDLILTGRQAADWDAGIVGCGVAELLGIPVISFARDIRISGDRVVVDRVLDDGGETVETTLPCVVTIANELGEPRKASLRETMRAAKKPQSSWSIHDLGLDGQALDQSGKRQIRERLFQPVRSNQCELIAGSSSDEIAANLASKLSNLGLI